MFSPIGMLNAHPGKSKKFLLEGYRDTDRALRKREPRNGARHLPEARGHPRDQAVREENAQQADHGDGHEEEVDDEVGEPHRRLGTLPLLDLREGRNERGAHRPFSEEIAEQIRYPEGDLEGVDRESRAEEGGEDLLADEAEDTAQQGGQRDDAGGSREPGFLAGSALGDCRDGRLARRHGKGDFRGDVVRWLGRGLAVLRHAAASSRDPSSLSSTGRGT